MKIQSFNVVKTIINNIKNKLNWGKKHIWKRHEIVSKILIIKSWYKFKRTVYKYMNNLHTKESEKDNMYLLKHFSY